MISTFLMVKIETSVIIRKRTGKRLYKEALNSSSYKNRDHGGLASFVVPFLSKIHLKKASSETVKGR